MLNIINILKHYSGNNHISIFVSEQEQQCYEQHQYAYKPLVTMHDDSVGFLKCTQSDML